MRPWKEVPANMFPKRRRGPTLNILTNNTSVIMKYIVDMVKMSIRAKIGRTVWPSCVEPVRTSVTTGVLVWQFNYVNSLTCSFTTDSSGESY